MNESFNIGLRISKLVDLFANGVNTKFAEAVGTSEANIRNYKSGKMPKLDFLIDVCSKFEINYEWLITGQGSMLKGQTEPKFYPADQGPTTGTAKASDFFIPYHTKNDPDSIDNNETRPRIPMDAAAGSLSVCLDGVTNMLCEQMPVIKAFSKYDFTIFTRGDSMLPEYHSGDELAGLYIKETSFIQWGRVHILDTTQGIIVKRIFDGGDCICCKSDNGIYSDFKIHKEEIYNIALVIGMLRRY